MLIELQERRNADAELAGLNSAVDIESLEALLLKHRQIARNLQDKWIRRTGMEPDAPTIRVTLEQHAMVKNWLQTAIFMALAMKEQQRVAEEKEMLYRGINGVISGAAIEIIKLLGLEPAYETGVSTNR